MTAMKSVTDPSFFDDLTINVIATMDLRNNE